MVNITNEVAKMSVNLINYLLRNNYITKESGKYYLQDGVQNFYLAFEHLFEKTEAQKTFIYVLKGLSPIPKSQEEKDELDIISEISQEKDFSKSDGLYCKGTEVYTLCPGLALNWSNSGKLEARTYKEEVFYTY